MIPRIVITGAPGSGKTKFVQRLRDEPFLNEFVFFDELARQLLEQEPAIRHDRHRFHMEIYRRQIEREAAIGSRPFISDRGTVDAVAFHPAMLDHLGASLNDEYKRYSAVVHLESSAVLGDEFYKTDKVRNETIPEALAIQKAIAHAWHAHPEYYYVPACPDIEDKYRAFRETVLMLAGKTEKQD